MSTLPRIVDGIHEIAHEYDWFVVDQWGVLHDGYTAHPGAHDCLRALRSIGPVALISNTSRRVDSARAVLRQLGFSDDLYDACFTAGELAARWLEARTVESAQRLRVFSLLRPPGVDSLLHTVQVDIVQDVDSADVILVEGTDGGARTQHDATLQRAQERQLPLLCGNPDVRSIQPDGSFLWCPGAFAEQYAALGGSVFHFGKPRPGIYEAARTATGGRSRGLA
ncbi:MAG TPA: TIGR01459 family HAD-type hydrolase, partial [Deltaproteobacteria bacterium]|nr:TIGR01459 family HAD-type hydrolase [Deltaproteobacteria bacterium]